MHNQRTPPVTPPQPTPFSLRPPGGANNKSLDAQLKKEGIEYFGYLLLESQPINGVELRNKDGIVERKPLKGKRVISSQNSRTIPILDKECFNILAELWLQKKELLNKRVYGTDPKNYLLFEGLNKFTFGNLLRSVCRRHKIGPYTPHCCRHTFATEFTGMVMGNIFLCQLVLGHADTSTTRKYIHLWEQVQKDLKSEAQLREGISLIE
ncbi:MAG: site-specific integrase [Oligoflexia bacterium]|nr:site-specific integrase [Oligoflexia bacterium]